MSAAGSVGAPVLRRARRRLFFGLWPDESCCAELAAAMRSADVTGPGHAGRAVPLPDWHVTLCFLGAVEERLLPALHAGAAAVQLPAFELRFGRLRCWAEAGVVAALADCPPEAAALAAALRSICLELGLSPDEKPLRPHITLVRGLRGQSWHGAREATLNLRLAAREFCLAESQEGIQAPAVRYRTLARWPLLARGTARG